MFLIDFYFQQSDVIYLRVSQCIFDTRKPGNVNRDPRKPQVTANVNLTISFEAGPL